MVVNWVYLHNQNVNAEILEKLVQPLTPYSGDLYHSKNIDILHQPFLDILGEAAVPAKHIAKQSELLIVFYPNLKMLKAVQEQSKKHANEYKGIFIIGTNLPSGLIMAGLIEEENIQKLNVN